MDLLTVTPAGEVSEAFKDEASKWHIWDSAVAKYPKKFQLEYPEEERILMISGSGKLTPTGGGNRKSITIGAGDAVTFHRGLSCKWQVLEPIQKFFSYAEPAEDTCLRCTAPDCAADCGAESYVVVSDGPERHVCPKCFKKARGAERRSYVGARHLKNGEPFVEEEDDEAEDETAGRSRKRAKKSSAKKLASEEES
jgi:uncharacterized cupin superfamily protein